MRSIPRSASVGLALSLTSFMFPLRSATADESSRVVLPGRSSLSEPAQEPDPFIRDASMGGIKLFFNQKSTSLYRGRILDEQGNCGHPRIAITGSLSINVRSACSSIEEVQLGYLYLSALREECVQKGLSEEDQKRALACAVAINLSHEFEHLGHMKAHADFMFFLPCIEEETGSVMMQLLNFKELESQHLLDGLDAISFVKENRELASALDSSDDQKKLSTMIRGLSKEYQNALSLFEDNDEVFLKKINAAQAADPQNVRLQLMKAQYDASWASGELKRSLTQHYLERRKEIQKELLVFEKPQDEVKEK